MCIRKKHVNKFKYIFKRITILVTERKLINFADIQSQHVGTNMTFFRFPLNQIHCHKMAESLSLLSNFSAPEKKSVIKLFCLSGPLAGKVADSINDLKGVVFAYGFGGITDMQISPDGYLYVLSLYEGGNNCAAAVHVNIPCISYTSSIQGTIFRIVPTKTAFVR